MSSLALRISDVDAPALRLVGAGFPLDKPAAMADRLDAEATCPLLGIGPRQFERLCKGPWAQQGKAFQERPADGGKARWVVLRSADPRLAANPFPQYIAPDLAALTEAQRCALAQRGAILAAWREACAAAIRAGGTRAEGTEKYLRQIRAEGLEISASTLYAWEERYRAGGVNEIKDRRWSKGEAPADRRMLEFAAQEWLRDKNGMKARSFFELAEAEAKKQGWRLWSYRSTLRHLQSIPMGQQLYLRGGKTAFNDRGAAYLERDYSTLASNELWNSDHHVCDVMVRTGEKIDPQTGVVKYTHERPWLTAWQDCRSRKIVGFVVYLGDPNSDRIIFALGRAVRVHGVPINGAVDNGKDFDSYALHGRTKKERRSRKAIDPKRIAGAFALLDIKVSNVQPYHGQSKPIERFFGTFEDRFGKRWLTYCGRSPEHKPEGLQDRLDAGKAPTLEEFAAAVGEWIENGYNAREHTGDGVDGKTPDQCWAENLAVKRTAPEANLDVLLWAQSKPVKVTRNGVRWNGLAYGQYQEELYPYMGQQVTLRVDPEDVARVAVWTMEGKFICIAPANRKVPANAGKALLREAIAENKADGKKRRGYHAVRMRMHEDLTDRMARLEAEKKKAQRVPPDDGTPAAIRPIRTPIDGELPALQRALEQSDVRRKAVGDGTPHPAQFEYSVDDMLKAFSRAEDDAPAGFIYHRPALPTENIIGPADGASAATQGEGHD